MLHHMWEISPVSAAIVIALAFLAIILVSLLIRLVFKAFSRGYSLLVKLTVRSTRPARGALQQRQLLERLRSAPAMALKEFETLVWNHNEHVVAWLARRMPPDTPLHEHLRAVSALLTLHARLPEQRQLKGDATILSELYRSLPELADRLMRRMRELAAIQHSSGNPARNHDMAYYDKSIREAARIRQQLERITVYIPALLAHSFSSASSAQIDGMALDLESLANTIRELL